MRFVLLAALLVASTISGQTPCSECPEPGSNSCLLWPEACEQCYEDCVPDVPPPRRIAPIGPSRQPGVDYVLPKSIGIHSLNYKSNEFQSWSNNSIIIHDDGFTTQELWIDIPPYCAGHWEQPFPSHLWVQDEDGCDFEWIVKHGPARILFLRIGVVSWMVNEGQGCYIMDTAPLGFIVNRLYDMAWYRDITVVLVPWEQDWYAQGCPGTDGFPAEKYLQRLDWLVSFESERQRQVEQARAAKMKQYPGSRLQVLHAMVVNKFPGYNIRDKYVGLPTLSEKIGEMTANPLLHEPDLVGISYWKRGLDPVPALDYVKESTKYPKYRLFIAEFGARGDEQPQRYLDYIPIFREWGMRTILIWVHKDYWNHGGNYTITPAGLDALRELDNDFRRD